MKIIIITNHFQFQDGVCRAAIGMANAMAKRDDLEVTLCPLFSYDKRLLKELDNRVTIKPIFKFYFRGFQRVIDLIPKRILHGLIIGSNYDTEIGFCMKEPIQLVASCSKNNKRNKNLVAWMHGYDEGLSLLKEYEEIGKVICVSKHNAERLKRESNGKFFVDYAYNIVDESLIERRGKEEIDIDRPSGVLFCSVGRFTSEKGFIRLINVVKQLNDDGFHFHLWLIGDGPEYVLIQRKIDEFNIRNVSLLGQKDNPHAYTSKADVFICSSFSEGYSTACTEAVILGVPVISTSVSGAEEIISNSKAGMVVENSEKGLYKGMRTVLQDDEIIKGWKRDIIEGRLSFSASNCEEKYYEIVTG